MSGESQKCAERARVWQKKPEMGGNCRGRAEKNKDGWKETGWEDPTSGRWSTAQLKSGEKRTLTVKCRSTNADGPEQPKCP